MTDVALALVLEAFAPNELIIREGDTADAMYIVQVGPTQLTLHYITFTVHYITCASCRSIRLSLHYSTLHLQYITLHVHRAGRLDSSR